jgi:hypothetical protein
MFGRLTGLSLDMPPGRLGRPGGSPPGLPSSVKEGVHEGHYAHPGLFDYGQKIQTETLPRSRFEKNPTETLTRRNQGEASRIIFGWLAGLSSAVVKALELLEVKSCLIDGELVVADERGLAVFELLRNGRQVKPQAHLIAFDLLEVDGRELRTKHPQGRARAPRPRRTRRLQLCEHIDQPGDVVFAPHACKLGCEGIVSKRQGSRYRPGPTKCPDWIKVKNPAASAVKREAEEEWNR